MLVQVAERCKEWVCGSSLSGFAVSNPAGGHGYLSVLEFCVLSGRGLCLALITVLEQSYRLWCVWV
jgi:hypothetical protein